MVLRGVLNPSGKQTLHGDSTLHFYAKLIVIVTGQGAEYARTRLRFPKCTGLVQSAKGLRKYRNEVIAILPEDQWRCIERQSRPDQLRGKAPLLLVSHR
jgi:hypothetical protein